MARNKFNGSPGLLSLVGASAFLAGTPSIARAQGMFSPSDFPAAGVDTTSWVPTPAGAYVHPSCVHTVPSGSHIDGNLNVWNNGVITETVPRCTVRPVSAASPPSVSSDSEVPTINNWVEDTFYVVPSYDSNIATWAGGNWTVPQNPTDASATLFFYDDLDFECSGSNPGAILQPVLQWNDDYPYWNSYGMQSWAVFCDGTTFNTGTVAVYPGDYIYGVTYADGWANSTEINYQIDWYDQTRNTEGAMSLDTGLMMQFTRAEVLEAYNVTTCTEFPYQSEECFYNVELGYMSQAASHIYDFNIDYMTFPTDVSGPWQGVITSGQSPWCGFGWGIGSEVSCLGWST